MDTIQENRPQAPVENFEQAPQTKEPVGTPLPTDNQPTESPVDDLITRVSKLQTEVKPVEETFEGFDYKEIEKIQDPVAKEQALNAYKSFQKGFNKKFQELAEIKKALEGKGQQDANWTPERIQQLLNDQNFVSAAQSVMSSQQQQGNLSDEEYSALTDTEKQQWRQMQSQLNMMTQQNSKLIQQQQDEKLRGKYANYSPATIDSMTQRLLNGQYQATREDIHKVVDYDAAVKRAYELGKQDRQLDVSSRVESNTPIPTGHQVTQANDVPEKEKGESNFNYFQRIARRRLSQSKDGQLK